MVDRLERQLADTASMVKVNAMGQAGRALASRYGMQGLPTFIVIDGSGQVVYRQSGVPDIQAILKALAIGAEG